MLRPLCGLFALATASVAAQPSGPGLNSALGFGYGGEGGSLHSGGGGAWSGAGSSGGRGFYITPTLGATATLTNNTNLSATDKQSDLILSVSPGVQIGGQSGRVRGFLNYALTGSYSARRDDQSSLYSTLSANANVEAVSNWMFVDVNASVSQQLISPFGTQSIDPNLNNSNSTQVRTVSVAPYVQGQIAGQVNYVGRAFYTYTDSGSSQAADSAAWGALLGFDSTTRWSRLSWGLDFTYREVNFSNQRSEFDQLNVLSLNYAVTPELRVSVRGNVETSNLTTLDSETTTGFGGGLRWTPSPRTNLVLEYDQRVFGNSHLYSLDYRTPRTVWAISNRQGLSTGQFNSGRGNPGSPFDLLFAQFAAVEPDPVARAQLVNAFLQANGINPNASLNTGYLPNQVVLEQRQEASAAWLGQRSTMVFSIYQTQSENVATAALEPTDPFANGNATKWRGGSVVWSHRLTPRDTLSVSGSGQRTTQRLGDQETTYWTAMAMWSSQLAQRVTGSLSARYQNQSGTSSYNEAALLATLNMTF
ncbi:MAG: TIGR03016 family PEP-CTERM system-associated outer membrane protein [Burkholderiaceae bacterium]|nr:TIGR03016 family PEP-CTERM system-associated outer membrane protein [Burkholderiaceae bacterium]